MKKVTFTLSALAITATVGTAMAYSKALIQQYCVAYVFENPSDPESTRIPYPNDGNYITFNTCSLTLFLRQKLASETAQFYGFPKAAGVDCPHVFGCAAEVRIQ